MAIHHAPALNEPFAVSQWSAWPLSVPLTRPYRSAKGTLSAIPMLHTQARSADGLLGNSVVFVPSVALLKSVVTIVSSLGLDLGETKRTALDHTSVMRRKLGAWGHEGIGACALAALELALLDAISQHSRSPIGALFGATPKTLATYGGIGLGDLAETVQEAGLANSALRSSPRRAKSAVLRGVESQAGAHSTAQWRWTSRSRLPATTRERRFELNSPIVGDVRDVRFAAGNSMA
jgi:hypothetical protein